MATEQATVGTVSTMDPGFGELRQNWGWLLAAGILSVVLGTIGLGMSFALTLASVLFFGVFLAVGGVIELAQAFKSRGWKSFVLHVAIAALHVAAGVVIITDPLVASSLLTLLLAGAILGIGAARFSIEIRAAGSRACWPGW